MSDQERIHRLERAMARVVQLRRLLKDAEAELREELAGAEGESSDVAVRVRVMVDA